MHVQPTRGHPPDRPATAAERTLEAQVSSPMVSQAIQHNPARRPGPLHRRQRRAETDQRARPRRRPRRLKKPIVMAPPSVIVAKHDRSQALHRRCLPVVRLIHGAYLDRMRCFHQTRSPLPRFVAALLLLAALAGCAPSVYTLRERGMNAYQAERYELAQRNFERVIEREPADAMANYYLGLLALKEDRANDARNHLEIAYTLFEAQPQMPPEMDRLLDALAEAMYRQGETRQLIAFTEQAINRSGKLSDYLRKAEYLMRLGDHDSALTAYRTAINIAEPGDPTAHLALADFYESLGDRGKALATLKRAYRVDPDHERTAERLRSYGVVPGPTLLEVDADD